ncbi:transporter substrate-binding domain-containing protein [Curvibacter sp. APW13]|uniref:substrate-binding periplasmic protein n=1 Tax=Curvibacter sp. APW13 TaxID=3077236 RepID=UPI0028DEB0CB|nr:transporter substrate-binding domain-containing protein [Curvibacter sp. APW13]MDT8990251.1 transporter substrate-binding domain-containing protein [Curvibacter sp. APW13]
MVQRPLVSRILATMLALAWCHASAQDLLRASVSTAWNMPFGDVQGDRIHGGILFDLYKAIAQKAGLTLVPVVLPRKRIDGAVVNGEVDLRCYFNPKWTSTPDSYDWSKPLFPIQDVLFGHTGTAELRSVQDIERGTAISTVLGYSYPTLEPLLLRGDLKRDDSVDEEKVLLKMTADRTPYGVAKSIALDWYKRQVPHHQLAPWRLVIDSADVYCAVPRNTSIAAPRLLGAIEELRKSGRIDAILKAYR